MKDCGRLFTAANIFVPIGLGSAVYVLCTSDTWAAEAAGRVLGAIPRFSCGNGFLRCYFSDICWAYSLVFSLWAVSERGRWDWAGSAALGAVFAAVMEAAQSIPGVRGTYDPLDILYECMACLAAGLMIRIKLWRNGNEKDDSCTGSDYGADGVCADGDGQRQRLR